MSSAKIWGTGLSYRRGGVWETQNQKWTEQLGVIDSIAAVSGTFRKLDAVVTIP